MTCWTDYSEQYKVMRNKWCGFLVKKTFFTTFYILGFSTRVYFNKEITFEKSVDSYFTHQLFKIKFSKKNVNKYAITAFFTFSNFNISKFHKWNLINQDFLDKNSSRHWNEFFLYVGLFVSVKNESVQCILWLAGLLF